MSDNKKLENISANVRVHGHNPTSVTNTASNEQRHAARLSAAPQLDLGTTSLF
jgi:hypothetical protein